MKKFIAPIAALSILASPLPVGATTDIESNIRNIVYIECGNWENDECIPVVSGSGVAIGESHVITNAHVVADEDGYYYEDCIGGISASSYVEPEFSFWLEPVVGRYDDYFDYAIMAVENDDGSPHELDSYVEFANSDAMVLNESIYVLGYPSTGGATITASIGSISGFTGTNWFKSDVDIDHGNSGGGAFDALGNFFAIPTAAVAGEINSISYLQGINAILEDAFGADIIARLKGRILLQVEEHGEAWYIHPDTCRRIYMKDGDEAYDIMRFLSLGIANADLEKFPSGTMSY